MERTTCVIDRFSMLPDEVICHILSFLPTKLSVSTCVIAKRWRFLWADVPVWDFEGDPFRSKTPNSDFFYRVTLLHKPRRLHTLRLKNLQVNEYQLETWISTAIEHKIRNFNLDFVYPSIALLHQTLFNYEAVVGMRLANCKGFSSTGDICLPSLKKLHLSKVGYEDDKALPHLLSGCPVLQELILDCLDTENDMRFFNISSSTIKVLEVNRLIIFMEHPFWILANAPALRCLRLVDCDIDRITIPMDMASLVEVAIRFKYPRVFNIYDIDSSIVVQCFNRLRNISCLRISSRKYLTFIGGIVGSTVKFNNLTQLELQLGVEWHLLVEFLEVADNLQVLIADVYIPKSCMEPKQVPKCLQSSLKTITIKIDKGIGKYLPTGFEEHELDLVRYLLMNSHVLERMEILSQIVRSNCTWRLFHVNDLTAVFKSLRRISLFERGSQACQIAFF